MQLNLFMFFLTLYPSFCEDYYELLGLKRNADQKTIRQAFKKLAVTLHPDKNSDDPEAHIKFTKYTIAYEVLKDPELRKKYDIYGEEGLNGASKQQNYHSWNYYQENFGIYDDDPQIVTLNTHDYDDNVLNSEKIWMINFYSTMCSHCHHLAPVWRQIAKDLEGVIRVGAVNCDDDWRLCRQLGIQVYPTLLFYPKNSAHGIRYSGDKSYDEINEFILERLDVAIKKLSADAWRLLITQTRSPDAESKSQSKPMLIFSLGKQRNIFVDEEQRKIAAIFENILDVATINCDTVGCDDHLSSQTAAVFLKNTRDHQQTSAVLLDHDSVNSFVHTLLDQLPELQELTAEEFELIRDSSSAGWLLCFYMGHATDLDLQLKRLPSILPDVNLGKINCAKYSTLCSNMNINRYPMWGVFKPGGAFELNHGKNTINDVARFAENSIRATNVWALSAEKVLAILKREDDGPWFLDWYAPWCPPCLQFLPEVRKASLEFETKIIRFGTVDCTVHAQICRKYNIRSYPTATLINGSITSQFIMHKNAANIVEFIKEAINPSVVKLTDDLFDLTLRKKPVDELWAVDYFAPWCGPCQQLAPEWTNVAKTLGVLTNVKIASVDCEAEADLCRKQGIRSYPTIRVYPLDSFGLKRVAMYSGSRDSASLITWIASFLPVKIKEFNEESLERKVFNSKKDFWIVDYFAPWCGHCQRLEPHFMLAAQLLDSKVKFGRFNCDKYRDECGRIGIRAYPTVIIYPPKSKRGQDVRTDSKYGGKRLSGATAEEIRDEVMKYLKHFDKNNRHQEL